MKALLQQGALPADNQESPKQESDPFPAYSRIFQYGTSTEYTFQALGAACALGSGVGMTLVNLVFGKFITLIVEYNSGSSDPSSFRSGAGRLGLYFFVIGIRRFALTYGYSTLLTLAAYRITRNIQCEYLRAGLRQEIAFFDQGTAGSIAMQATSNGRLVQAGISEKLGLVFQGISTLISAFVLAFVKQWKLTVICCCIVPATLLVIGLSSTIEAMIEVKLLKNQALAETFVESILSTPRTIQAFGLQSRLKGDLDKYLLAGLGLGKKKNPLFGFLLSTEYFISAEFGDLNGGCCKVNRASVHLL